MSKILVTGATGFLGKGTIEFLLKKGISPNDISALVRNEENAADLKEKGINIVVGDYENYTSLISAFKDVDKLLFVSSSDVINRTPHHENVVKAAKEAGVKHIFYTSAENNKDADDSAIGFVGITHKLTEKWIKESGLTYTLLRNNLYVDVVPMFIGENILETGTIYLPASNGRAAWTLRSDMAEATANVLASEGHEGKTYSITNVDSYTYQDVANAITEITDKQISYVSPTVEEFQQALKSNNVPEEYIGLFTGFAVAQAEGEFDVTGSDLENLLGRKPTTLKEFLKTVYNNN